MPNLPEAEKERLKELAKKAKPLPDNCRNLVHTDTGIYCLDEDSRKFWAAASPSTVTALLEEVEELKKAIEEEPEGIGEVYCPKCGSCGIADCCNPKKCIVVKGCLHGKGLTQEWSEMSDQWDKAETRAELAEAERDRMRDSLQLVTQSLVEHVTHNNPRFELSEYGKKVAFHSDELSRKLLSKIDPKWQSKAEAALTDKGVTP